MIPFFSRRNQVYGVLWNCRPAVEKHFSLLSDWEEESSLYAALEGRLSCPTVLHMEPGLLVTEYLPYPTLLEELERQEQAGFSPAPWLALARWLERCHEAVGLLPGEGNLRNYLWDSSKKCVIGLDLEGFRPMTPNMCGARIAAALLSYAPAHTPLKRRATALFSGPLGVSREETAATLHALEARRSARRAQPLTGIVLAGGASSRMGRNKAELKLLGVPLLVRQAEKLRRLGAGELLLSGSSCPSLPECRVIPDEYQNRGPLGGLHACLKAARHSRCLVLSVDAPLLPLSALAQLLQSHGGGVTVLRHGNLIEPLIGVYDKHLSGSIEALICRGGAPVRALQAEIGWNTWTYLGPEELLQNCNTPEDFSQAEDIAALRLRYGLPF